MPAPAISNLPFLRPDGASVRLAEFLTSDALLLVFLRHLA